MSNQPQEQQGLMLGDRINWPYILGSGVLKFYEAIIREEGNQSEQQVRESALTLYHSIPSQWVKKDDQFKKDVKAAFEKKDVDVRKIFQGRRVGKPKFKKEEVLDPYRLFQACVDVFQRRGLLSKTVYTEKLVPEPEDFEEKDANTNNETGE